MSIYTTEVRFICETFSGLDHSVGYNDVEAVLNRSALRVLNMPFPIFDEAYRKPLCIKILRHYYTREIAHETVGLWQLKMGSRLNEIMPYYNELYKTTLLEFDPFKDTDYYTKRDDTGTHKETGSRTDTYKDGSERWDMYQDTPQGGLQGVRTEDYLSSAEHITDDKNHTGSRTDKKDINTVDDFLEHVYGKRGGQTYMELVKQIRENILNIDMMIINDLKDLFFGLWE